MAGVREWSAFVVGFTAILLVGVGRAHVAAQFPVSGGFTIGDGLYTLQWQVQHNFISFQAMGRTNGYVGFGISPTGKGMEGADMFVGGMFDNGTAYAYDVHGGPNMDEMTNYVLVFAGEDPMYTAIHFQRLLDTGDSKDDLPIKNEMQYIMWSLGPKMDTLEHHGPENRGFVQVNLLNPPVFHTHYAMKSAGDKPVEP